MGLNEAVENRTPRVDAPLGTGEQKGSKFNTATGKQAMIGMKCLFS
jgi:hypothetical protein